MRLLHTTASYSLVYFFNEWTIDVKRDEYNIIFDNFKKSPNYKYSVCSTITIGMNYQDQFDLQ